MLTKKEVAYIYSYLHQFPTSPDKEIAKYLVQDGLIRDIPNLSRYIKMLRRN